MSQDVQKRFAVTVIATGEVRDADGNLLNTQEIAEQIEVPISELRSFTDDQLRAAGLDEPTIAEIRSTT